jgi:hypothetical protein
MPCVCRIMVFSNSGPLSCCRCQPGGSHIFVLFCLQASVLTAAATQLIWLSCNVLTMPAAALSLWADL